MGRRAANHQGELASKPLPNEIRTHADSAMSEPTREIFVKISRGYETMARAVDEADKNR